MGEAGGRLTGSLAGVIDDIYAEFGGYRCPADLWVCEQCGPQWTAEDVRSTPLRSVSLPQLDAIHVMSLQDDGFRYFFPRLMDLLLLEPGPHFEFRLSELKSRLPRWRPTESGATRRLVEAIWGELLSNYPASLGYFSDSPTLLSFTDWCDMPLGPLLDQWHSTPTLPSARHLAELVDHMFTTRDPFDDALRTVLLAWVAQPLIGERLQGAFFAADTDAAANQLAAAHELWSVCAR
jgi:hypothetical protein